MNFWDTSALVPLLVREDHSALTERIARHDRHMVVCWGTPIEMLSAIARRELEGGLSDAEADDAREMLGLLGAAWNEVQAGDEVRDAAARLLRRHALRSADALQLGAALVWARGHPEGHGFFTFDERLAHAARQEGFDLVAPRGR